MCETVLAGEAITERQRCDVRMAMTQGPQCAAPAIHMVCAVTGVTSILNASPLKRYARDAEVVSAHNQLQFVNADAVGRAILGFEPNNPLC